jgi:hypothetical protein
MRGNTNGTLLTILFLTVLSSASVLGGANKSNRVAYDSVNTRAFQANRILVYINARGDLSFKDTFEGAWRFDPTSIYGDSLAPVVCDHGPWVIGKLNGIPSGGITYWGSSYMPGPVINGAPGLRVRPQDSLRYHPYEITLQSNSSNRDFAAWPSDLGAPIDPSGKPLLLGDALTWSVFNGADSSAYPSDFPRGTLPHLPVEIQQSVYAHASSPADTSLLGNTLFMEWTLINKGNAVIESCYVALWTDIDFDDMEHNFPAIDTALQVGYCWDGNLTPINSPYAVGYVLLHGPVVPDPSSNAVFRGRPRAGYRNLPLSSFWGIIYDGGPPTDFLSGPNSITSAWNIARGFDKTGGVIIDSVSRVPTRFPYSGDPISRTGWVYTGPRLKGSEGFIMFTGPFTFGPGDTQWVMTALVPALGSDRFESIRLLRNDASLLRAMPYDAIANARPLPVALDHELPSSFMLSQNYPNPFNPNTTIRYALPQRTHVSLSVFNTLGQEVATLVNEIEEAGNHEVRFDGSGLASGVYFYRMRAGEYVQTRKLLLLR